jgi:general secretion pathway protein A
MYLDFYRLSDEPFRVTPDPDFLFLADQYKEAMAAIVYGIAKRKGFVCITGEVGVGKTTILRSYLNSVEDKGLTFVYVFNPRVSFAVLMRTILRDLGQPTQGDVPEMVERLHEHLIACYRANTTVVLFVDEAQNMPLETLESLRMLSNLETSTDKLIQIVLVGQPELDDLLSRPQLRQLKSRIVVRAKLGPMNREDSTAYVYHRLNRVALDTLPVFSKSALGRIVKEAKGVPRMINILCDAAMITGFGYRLKPIPVKVVREVIRDTFGDMSSGRSPWVPRWVTAMAGIVVLLGLGLGAGALWQSQRSASADPIADLIRATEKFTPEASAPAPQPGPKVASRPRTAQPSDQQPDEVSDPAADLARVISPLPKPAAPSVTEQSAAAAPAQPPPPNSPPASAPTVAATTPPAAPQPPKAAPPDAQTAALPRAADKAPPAPTAAPVPAAPAAALASADRPPVQPASGNPNSRTIVVKHGDTLFKLSLDVYGTANGDLFGLLQHANPAITDIDRLYVGQVIAFPSLPDNRPTEQEAVLRRPR